MEAASPEAAASFASFLAGLADLEEDNPAAAGEDRWDCGELAQDVATFGSVNSAAGQENELVGRPDAPISVPAAGSHSRVSGQARRKTASVTIRMTQAECDQLQRRASAAGMTVSAYLRSCTFEAEALRAQVKEALAQFSAASAAPERREPNAQPEERLPMRRPSLRTRLFNGWPSRRDAVPDRAVSNG